MTGHMHEEELIAAARQGDQQAYARLMRSYKHMVYTVCMRVLRNREEAEEATQDSFVKAFRNLGAYQGGARFSTWLYSIAYRTALSALRTRRPGSVDLEAGRLRARLTIRGGRVSAALPGAGAADSSN